MAAPPPERHAPAGERRRRRVRGGRRHRARARGARAGDGALVTDRRTTAPWALAGGRPGATGENWLLPGGDASRARRLPDKVTVELAAGDVLRILTPGGGAHGVALASPDLE